MNQLRLPDVFGRRNGGLEPFRFLHRGIDQLFDEFSRSMPFRDDTGMMAVSLDVAETDNAIEITAEVPGASAEDIDVSLKDDVLTIKGEKRSEVEDKQKNYHVIERAYGSFIRHVPLPAEVDPNKVDAKFEKGLLKITLTKAPSAQSRVRKINIKQVA